jgi:hypothetical protein
MWKHTGKGFVWQKTMALLCTDYQYSETNVMHFLFSLFRIKGLYHVLHITCSSSAGTAQAALGILCAEIIRHLRILMYIFNKA